MPYFTLKIVYVILFLKKSSLSQFNLHIIKVIHFKHTIQRVWTDVDSQVYRHCVEDTEHFYECVSILKTFFKVKSCHHSTQHFLSVSYFL